MGQLPTLNRDQRAVVDAIFQHWKDNRCWPKRGRLTVNLKREHGIDFEKVLESMPHWVVLSNHSKSDEDPVRLMIRGLAMCSGTEHIIKAFCYLHRLSAERYSAAPHAKMHVSSADLSAFLSDHSPEDIQVMSDAIDEDFRFSSKSGDDGSWSRRHSESILLYERVSTIEEWISIYDDKIREVNCLKDSHVELLGRIYRHWCENDAWPDYHNFLVTQADKGGIYRLLYEMPRSHFWTQEQTASSPNQRLALRLTFHGVLASGEAEHDLEAVVKAIEVIHEHFTGDKGDEPITSAVVSNRINAEQPRMMRVAHLLHRAGVGVNVSFQEHSWTARVNTRILKYEGIKTVDEFMRVQYRYIKGDWRSEIRKAPKGSLGEVPAEPASSQSKPSKGEPKRWGDWVKVQELNKEGKQGNVYL